MGADIEPGGPMVSVVIPTFNRAAIVGDALQSAFQQSFQDMEVILVDDGSTDETGTVVQARFSDSRLRYHYQPNRGLAAARNRGIELARGQYIAFLDSDDLWLPHKLELQLAAFRRQPEAGVVYCDFRLIDEDGAELAKNWRPVSRGDLQVDLLFSNVIAGSGSAVITRADCFKEVGLFDERLATCEDHDMWRRLADRFAYVKVAEELVKIRVHQRSLQRDVARMQDGMLLHLQKILQTAPARHARYLPAVTRQFHRVIFVAWVRAGRFWKGVAFLVAQARRFPAIMLLVPPLLAWGAIFSVLRAVSPSAGERLDVALRSLLSRRTAD